MSMQAVAAAHRIGAEVAARHADGVDRQARFPAEAVGTLREARLPSAVVPAALGGSGHSLRRTGRGRRFTLDTPNSVGRHLRDLLSARMIGNGRIHAGGAALLQVHQKI
ncbi:hypothetical protein [Xylophilus sp.]|uniref:hypothetical protein n=1 Tax=Xylophilus sp. TaxID=2653893 RepID=UPI0013BA38A6|nr:MAG: hypothetical protein GAK38_04356 [Xylophilus sp.]